MRLRVLEGGELDVGRGVGRGDGRGLRFLGEEVVRRRAAGPRGSWKVSVLFPDVGPSAT